MIAPVFVNVEGDVGFADDFELGFLHRESRVDEQHGVLSCLAFRQRHERRVGCLHGAYGRDDACRADGDVHEVLDEARCFLREGGQPFQHGVELGNALFQGCDFSLCADLCGRQSGHAHFHADELFSRRFLQQIGNFHNVTDGSIVQIARSALCHG